MPNEDLLNDLVKEINNASSPEEAINRWLFSHGGRHVYLPAYDKERRDEGIKKFYKGNNLRETCTKFRVSRSTVYRLTSRR